MNLFRKTTEQRNHSTRSALKNFVFVEEANNSQLHESDTKLLLYGANYKIT